MPLTKVYSWYFIGYQAIEDSKETGVVEYRLLAPSWKDAVAGAQALKRQTHHRLVAVTELDVERMVAWHEELD